MANIVDYIEWRGDLTFRADPFNEVDNLLLSTASFLDLYGIVQPEPWSMPVKLSVCGERYREKYPDGRYYGVTIPAEMEQIFLKMAKAPRYRDIYVTSYVSDLDEKESKQFGALTLVLPDNSIFLSFRGTDDTIVGWREDFNLSFTLPVPSQQAAADYLATVAAFHRGDIRVGGHSKGGNLAVYAAAMAEDEVKERILAVYSNDGPGFMGEFLTSPQFRSVEKRVITYVPQSSVIGMLLANNGGYQVIESTGQGGLLQHDPLSWKVFGPSFVHLDGLSREGQRNENAFRHLLERMDPDRRRRFTEIVFEIIASTEAKTLTELTGDKVKNAVTMIRAYNELPKEEKDEVRRFIGALFGHEK